MRQIVSWSTIARASRLRSVRSSMSKHATEYFTSSTAASVADICSVERFSISCISIQFICKTKKQVFILAVNVSSLPGILAIVMVAMLGILAIVMVTMLLHGRNWRITGDDSVWKIMINDRIHLFFETAISILVISNHNSLPVLFDSIRNLYILSERQINISSVFGNLKMSRFGSCLAPPMRCNSCISNAHLSAYSG